ncbi:MAG: hypothetical protein M1483_08550 [Actinobacteria bacterium]|nr:hypothetical protein [Actinomycetota bacterium]MCL6105651.1 hypothetical protein [Actinomycetota bacterium]
MNTREEIEARVRVEMRKAEATMTLLSSTPTELIERCGEVERRHARALETYKQRKAEYDAIMNEVREFAAPYIADGVSRSTIASVLGVAVPAPKRAQAQDGDTDTSSVDVTSTDTYNVEYS